MFIFSLGFFPEAAAAAASLKLNMASPINAGAVTMLLGLVIVPVVSAFTKVRDTERVEEIFADCKNKISEK